MTAPRPYILAESYWGNVRATIYDVVILPWGATEAHNFHLPYSTDVIECDTLAAESARRAWEAGAKVMVLPTIPFGVNTGQRAIRFCMNMNPSTQAAVLRDVIETVELAGTKKLVIFNSHGGNDFRQILRELQPRTSVFLCTLNWWQVVDAKRFFTEPGDHAGEAETSILQHVTPHLVRPLGEAGAGAERKFALPGLKERWVWAQRDWPSITSDTGVGDPKHATAEKGKAFADAVCGKVAEFLVALAGARADELYEK
ncbi:MAG TPA: creatininase family protein [Gemmatimonadaceae bacterium]|nr:creatininase family protein [Gemmatimonadaceae bacterium]